MVGIRTMLVNPPKLALARRETSIPFAARRRVTQSAIGLNRYRVRYRVSVMWKRCQ